MDDQFRNERTLTIQKNTTPNYQPDISAPAAPVTRAQRLQILPPRRRQPRLILTGFQSSGAVTKKVTTAW